MAFGQPVVKDEGSEVTGGRVVQGLECRVERFALDLLALWVSECSPQTLLRMQTIRPRPRPAKAGTVGCGPAICVVRTLLGDPGFTLRNSVLGHGDPVAVPQERDTWSVF